MNFCITKGRESCAAPPFFVLQNNERHYLIRNDPDILEGMAHRTGPMVFINCMELPQRLTETSVMRALSNERRRFLYVDHCSEHEKTEGLKAAADNIITSVTYFPPKCTHLIHSYNSSFVKKIKNCSNTYWETH